MRDGIAANEPATAAGSCAADQPWPCFVLLQVFDFKLRHMRDDIAAIKASNNSLEHSMNLTFRKAYCLAPHLPQVID